MHIHGNYIRHYDNSLTHATSSEENAFLQSKLTQKKRFTSFAALPKDETY